MTDDAGSDRWPVPDDLPVNEVLTGDCFDRLPDLPDESVHAAVTDPPYGLAFMGESWDEFEPREYQDFAERFATELLRVLKPGGHLIAFSGNRTHHRLFSGIEDAGFEVRDTLTWHYLSGFPKAQDMGKLIDKRQGTYEDRDVTGEREVNDMRGGNYGTTESTDRDEGQTTTHQTTDPESDEAKRWDGWKAALKPATEFAVLARKPFPDATIDAVLNHGTGVLNIDGSEISTDDPLNYTTTSMREGLVGGDSDTQIDTSRDGRYPTNVILDGSDPKAFSVDVDDPESYFFCPKASKSERTLNGRIANGHPTIKPQTLMEYLIRLTTAEGQTVIDPFAGSGTTAAAAKALNRRFVAIERDPDWADVARVRAGMEPNDPSIVRENDDAQAGLETFTDGGNA